MPTTFTGLALFLIFLAPGLCFAFVRLRRHPERDRTPLQEVGVLLLSSVVCLGVVLIVFGFMRIVLAGHTPDVGRLVRAPSSYFRRDYGYLSVWAFGGFLAACGIGILLGIRDKLGVGRLVVPPPAISQDSGWRRVLKPVGKEVYARCLLDDGSAVGGFVNSFSPGTEENLERSLTLVAPIRVTRPGGNADLQRDLSAVIVGADRIVRLDVAYLDSGTADALLKLHGLQNEKVQIGTDGS